MSLENTRFHREELENDRVWAESLRHGAKLFVNDAFGVAHRAHASTVGIAGAVRAAGGEAVAGLLMERELRFLGKALTDPARPFVAVIGGAKNLRQNRTDRGPSSQGGSFAHRWRDGQHVLHGAGTEGSESHSSSRIEPSLQRAC